MTDDKEDINPTRDKLVNFPEFILDKLEEYRHNTGISASSYIKHAVVKQMVLDKLIYFKTEYITTINKEPETVQNPIPEELKFCDGDKCEFDPTKQGGC